jgi:hypothetical protein
MEIEGGESLRSVKVKVEDALVHGPKFTNVVDLVELEDQRFRLDQVGRVHFRFAEVELSDKEHACWSPAITINRRSSLTFDMSLTRSLKCRECVGNRNLQGDQAQKR